MMQNTKRNFDLEGHDTEDHKYAYGFDFDVMHPFMLRSFEPFASRGRLLELGSYRGDFTKRLIGRFDEIVCVEASQEALAHAEKRFGTEVSFIAGTFEDAILPGQFENVILTHVLEHVDDPIVVLKRINDEWLSPTGRLFVACPNGSAASRQIAVKMGLISHNTAITSAEQQHGHHRTYTLDTLEADATRAGLRVIHRSGIFFKALANFQWDRLLQTDIITPEYLEGCFKLGQEHPTLCSSIYLVCERGPAAG